MCGIIFNRHDWFEIGNRRICTKCNRKEIYMGDLVDGYWTEANRYSLGTSCSCCRGEGRLFNDNFDVITCAKCNGSGEIKNK